MPQGMVHIENLVKRYGDLTALNHLDLDIREGEIFGLLGPNGSGKTTAISCLLSLLKYDRGQVEIFGEEMKPDSYKIKEQIGIVLQNIAVFEELTVQENIDYFCGLYIRDKKRRKELVEEAIEFTGLEDFRKMHPKKLSGGLLRRLNIACGIAHKPRLIIMDEPNGSRRSSEQKQDPGRNPDTEPARLHHYLHFPLHGRGRADLHQDRHHGSRKSDRAGNKRGTEADDQNRRDHHSGSHCPGRKKSPGYSHTGSCV